MTEASAEEDLLKIGDWHLSAARNLLTDARGEVRLEPRQVDLLLFLARNRGEVLSADRIIESVWEGQVVTDQSVYQAIAKLRRALDDDAGQPRYIETVPKRGYRLIAEVTSEEAGATSRPVTPRRPRRRPIGARLRGLGLPGGIVLLLIIAVGLLTRSTADQAPTVLVLPFESLTGDAEDALVGKGFAIELAHVIGRSGRIRVIGPTSTGLLAAAPTDDPTTVDTDFVVEGSLRPRSDGYRVAANLIDVESGQQLWSQVFDSDGSNVIQAQQQVARALADVLDQAFASSSPTKPVRLANSNRVYDDYLLGRYYRSLRSGDALERAIGHFSSALAGDPDYVPALHGIAGAYLLSSFYGSMSLGDAVAAATENLRRAAALAPDDAEQLSLYGLMNYLQGNYGRAEDNLERAVDLHPNLVEGWMWLGLARRQQGRLADALPAFLRASQLEPLLVTSVVNYANALAWSGSGEEGLDLLQDLAATTHDGFANRDQLYRAISGLHQEQGQLDVAYDWAQRALEQAPASPLSLANMAIVKAMLGRDGRAVELATLALGPSSAGRGTTNYLARLDIVMSQLSPDGSLLQSRALEIDAAQPEIEWRRARLYTGMRAYMTRDYAAASRQLQQAFDGRSYPVSRVDRDLYACIALADALGRGGHPTAAKRQRKVCRAGLDGARAQAWDTLAMKLSELRLAILADRRAAAEEMLPLLFADGLRSTTLLRDDPLLATLADTPAYDRLIAQIDAAIADANRNIDAIDGQ